LPFSVFVPGGNAFANAGIAVHDVTGLPAFRGPGEPPFLDILVVTNVTHTTSTLQGSADGFINHFISLSNARQWSWDTKGASYVGTANAYGTFTHPATKVEQRGTFVYHLNLMHYIFNRPYRDEQPGATLCGATLTPLNPAYVGVLDPPDLVEDFRQDNGTGPQRLSGLSEDRYRADGGLNGDRKQSDWKNRSYTPAPGQASQAYHVGCHFSLFDANGNGLVEHPPLSTAQQLLQLKTGGLPRIKEYTPLELQTHTVLHEMGHAVGMAAGHTSDPLDLMYNRSLNWGRAGHFGSQSRSQIYIHNQ
jgi:hypothetical protein